MQYLQIVVSGPRADLEKIARELVEDRLAACVQISGPIISTYWWNGKVEEAEEWLALIKSSRELYQEVEGTIKRLHSYQVPEILAMPVEGSHDYLQWLKAELRKK